MRLSNWVIAPSKYLSPAEARTLLQVTQLHSSQGSKVTFRDAFIIHLALATGLRVMEMAALNCGDLFLSETPPSLVVRRGKGGKTRLVYFYEAFRHHCTKYLHWKRLVGESVAPHQPLLLSSNTGRYMTTRAIEKVFKRWAVKANLPAFYSIHSLRHTYACLLLRASHWNLRYVQKQLGHSRLTTTQVYADVFMPDIEKTLDPFVI